MQTETSLYRYNAHIATVLFDIKFRHGANQTAGRGARITAGGSLFISSGSQPASYYQPLVKLLVPLRGKLACFGEWRYYGYGEVFSRYEGFRANLLTTGLRFTPGARSTSQ